MWNITSISSEIFFFATNVWKYWVLKYGKKFFKNFWKSLSFSNSMWRLKKKLEGFQVFSYFVKKVQSSSSFTNEALKTSKIWSEIVTWIDIHNWLYSFESWWRTSSYIIHIVYLPDLSKTRYSSLGKTDAPGVIHTIICINCLNKSRNLHVLQFEIVIRIIFVSSNIFLKALMYVWWLTFLQFYTIILLY